MNTKNLLITLLGIASLFGKVSSAVHEGLTGFQGVNAAAYSSERYTPEEISNTFNSVFKKILDPIKEKRGFHILMNPRPMFDTKEIALWPNGFKGFGNFRTNLVDHQYYIYGDFMVLMGRQGLREEDMSIPLRKCFGMKKEAICLTKDSFEENGLEEALLRNIIFKKDGKYDGEYCFTQIFSIIDIDIPFEKYLPYFDPDRFYEKIYVYEKLLDLAQVFLCRNALHLDETPFMEMLKRTGESFLCFYNFKELFHIIDKDGDDDFLFPEYVFNNKSSKQFADVFMTFCKTDLWNTDFYKFHRPMINALKAYCFDNLLSCDALRINLLAGLRDNITRRESSITRKTSPQVTELNDEEEKDKA